VASSEKVASVRRSGTGRWYLVLAKEFYEARPDAIQTGEGRMTIIVPEALFGGREDA